MWGGAQVEPNKIRKDTRECSGRFIFNTTPCRAANTYAAYNRRKKEREEREEENRFSFTYRISFGIIRKMNAGNQYILPSSRKKLIQERTPLERSFHQSLT